MNLPTNNVTRNGCTVYQFAAAYLSDLPISNLSEAAILSKLYEICFQSPFANQINFLLPVAIELEMDPIRMQQLLRQANKLGNREQRLHTFQLATEYYQTQNYGQKREQFALPSSWDNLHRGNIGKAVTPQAHI